MADRIEFSLTGSLYRHRRFGYGFFGKYYGTNSGEFAALRNFTAGNAGCRSIRYFHRHVHTAGQRSRSASLSFSSNAANSPAVQSMTGSGNGAVQHTVGLTWNASINAVSYNLYRGSVPGGPYSMINTTLDGTTAYTDSTVSSGQTYYYVATAVDDNSEESGYSNEAQAVIPNP